MYLIPTVYHAVCNVAGPRDIMMSKTEMVPALSKLAVR